MASVVVCAWFGLVRVVYQTCTSIDVSEFHPDVGVSSHRDQDVCAADASDIWHVEITREARDRIQDDRDRE